MSRTQTLETKTLVNAMESRAKEYDTLRIQFRELKTSFRDITNLYDFKGKTAESVKGFYRAQIDVVDAWLDFIDLQEAFLKGVKGLANDVDLGEDTLVHLPFLDSDLKNSENRARQIVDGQEQALQDIFSGIEDIMSLEPYSTKRFDNHIDKATKDRKETKEKVESLDQTLVEHYVQSKYHENIIVGLISELYQASMQGGEVNPLYFNEDTYRNSDIHTAKEEAKKITAEYISWQDELEKARELENRSFGEKTWDTICTFTGEVTGYYDMKRATTGIDPVTGEELTGGQRATAAALAAAGFIPFVGWAGRAVKGGHAIYKTSKTFKAADNALDAYRTTEAFDILRKTEYGLYGLASANGFSEYITGKDMFGQELTEQQRQSSLAQSILVLAAGGGSVVVDRVQARNTVNHLFPTPTPPATNPGLRKPWNLEGAIQYVKDVTPRVRVVQDSLGNPHFMFMKGNGGGAGNTVKRVEPKKQDTVRQVESKGKESKMDIGKSDIDALRNKWNVPETETVAVGKTDVIGLEGLKFEGGSPKVRKEAGLPDLDEVMPDRNIKAPGSNPLFTRHAEEGVLNEFDSAVINAGIKPEDVTGTLKLHQSNPSGVCRKCYQGLANDKVPPGVLKQLSLKYPNLKIEVTSEIDESIKVTGRLNLMIKNGNYID